MSVLGWVLVGLVVWLLLAVATAVVLGRLVRANRHTTLDVLGARYTLTPDPLRVPDIVQAPDLEDSDDGEGLPSPRSGAHDDAEATAHRRRPRG